MTDANETNELEESLANLLIPSTYKVRGRIDDPGATGVFGYSTAGSGTGKGVVGQVDSDNDDAAAVHGEANNSDAGAAADGIKAITRGTGNSGNILPNFATGVTGQATNSSGSYTYGVYGTNNGTGNGTAGVLGWSFADDGQVYGVRGETNSATDGAAGVWGDTNDSSGQIYGVKGTTGSANDDAAGVRGEATQGSGVTYGVRGVTQSTNSSAAGVYGEGKGDADGVRARSQSGQALFVSGVNRQGDDRLYPSEHAAFIQDLNGDFSSVLALKTVDTTTESVADKFITFFDGGNNVLGAIEADGSGGVRFTGAATGDFAEYMPRLDPDEEIEGGDVVGVFGDAVTRRTDGADYVMVVSDQPLVTGNSPGQSDAAREGHETVAFVGQVPVKVRGTVEEGDVIVPSGEHDGTGRAIPAAEWTPRDGAVVGRAWEGADEEAVDRVTVAVGVESGEALEPAFENLTEELELKDDRITDLKAETERLREELSQRDDRIDDLEARTEQLDSRLRALEARADAAPTPADD